MRVGSPVVGGRSRGRDSERNEEGDFYCEGVKENSTRGIYVNIHTKSDEGNRWEKYVRWMEKKCARRLANWEKLYEHRRERKRE